MQDYIIIIDKFVNQLKTRKHENIRPESNF